MARPNIEEKTFAGGSKAMKFVNVFSLESFPLYGSSHKQLHHNYTLYCNTASFTLAATNHNPWIEESFSFIASFQGQ